METEWHQIAAVSVHDLDIPTHHKYQQNRRPPNLPPSATQTPPVVILGPQTRRTVPKGLLLNFALKWRWHLTPSSTLTVRIQDLPQPQLDFVLDWMLGGGDNYSGPGGLRVPDANITTMNLLLGFVETLGIAPLVVRVRMIKNGLISKQSMDVQALHGRKQNGTEFLIASVGDLVETYVFGVRSMMDSTSVAGDVSFDALSLISDSVVDAKVMINKVTKEKLSTEKRDIDNKAEK